MIARTLLFLLFGVVVPAASAGQSPPHADSGPQDGQVTAKPAARRPNQDIRNDETAERADNERFAVREDFGQAAAPRERTRWTAPDAIRERAATKTAAVDPTGDDRGTTGQTRARDDEGRTDKNDAARTMQPCAVNGVEASVAASASGSTPGAAATAAGGAIQQGCAN